MAVFYGGVFGMGSAFVANFAQSLRLNTQAKYLALVG